MSSTTILAIIVVLIIIIGFAFYVIYQKISGLKNDTAAGLIKQDMTNLSQSIEQLKDSLNTSVNERLDKSQTLMRDSIQKQFGESAKLITEVTQRLAKLDETNRTGGRCGR